MYAHLLTALMSVCFISDTDVELWVPKMSKAASNEQISFAPLIAECCNINPKFRPTIAKVVVKLTGIQTNINGKPSPSQKRKTCN